MVNVPLKKLAAGAALACAAGGAALVPHSAQAQYYAPGYVAPGYVAPPAVVVRPPVVYAPPPVVVVRPRPYFHHWVRAHYNRFGYFVPGHWI